MTDESEADQIALIGMAGRFPGAHSVGELWRNLCGGVESVSFFSDEEAASAGATPRDLRDPSYVKAAGVLDDVERFDARFFGYTPRDAQIIDPQHRVFLECAWEAFEDAGYDVSRYAKIAGVFASVGASTYFFELLRSLGLRRPGEAFDLLIGLEKDYLATRVAYKLDLKGPAITVQSACSSSLVAVHLACQNLLGYECDLALAGGVTIRVPQKLGYRHQEGGILSPDGHCRAFDESARGGVGGNGCGVVVLKRLRDALDDGDHIYAVIRGSAVNNDGARKVGYTAPGVEGQASVIAMAQRLAGVDPETIGYVETHGTGTALGDPVEIAALTRAFRLRSDARQFCAIGSLKTNIGHLDTAAGVAALIKTALVVRDGLVPPSLHFERPSPVLELERSPFYVATALQPWRLPGKRRAAVSSFGFGGTNAHAVLEEAPPRGEPAPGRSWKLVPLSARSAGALEAARERLREHVAARAEEIDVDDLAYTLQVGRRAFEHRSFCVVADGRGLADVLAAPAEGRLHGNDGELANAPVVFMFSGGGAQYVNMGVELYASERVFRDAIDACAQQLLPLVGYDIREVLHPTAEREEEAAQRLRKTAVALPCLFATEYALAQLWMSWGVRPAAMIGHSLGEYVAACLAGVFSLRDALSIVVTRSLLYDRVAVGAMLAVALSEAEVRPLLGPELAFAAINGPAQCTVTGPAPAVRQLQQRLEAAGAQCRELRIDVAGHSPAMAAVADELARAVAAIELHPPAIPFISNVTGTWARAERCTDPSYWAEHLCRPVRFGDGVATVLADGPCVLLEVGPGRTLTSLARALVDPARQQLVQPSLRHRYDRETDLELLLTAVGKLWLAGVAIDWEAFHGEARRRRVPLPTYPFEREHCWVEAVAAQAGVASAANVDPADPLFVPSWSRIAPLPAPPRRPASWLVIGDGRGWADAIERRLGELGQAVVRAGVGDQLRQEGPATYTVDPVSVDQLQQLWRRLAATGRAPRRVVSLLPRDGGRVAAAGTLALLQSLAARVETEQVEVLSVTRGAADVLGSEALLPDQAAAAGVWSAASDSPRVASRLLDLGEVDDPARAVDRLLAEAETGSEERELVAWRGAHRWIRTLTQIPRGTREPSAGAPLASGTWVVVGDPAPGRAWARALARVAGARLVVVPTAGSAPRWESEVALLRAAGADAALESAEATDPAAMSALAERLRDRVGAVNAVVYAPSLDDAGGAQPGELAATLAPVVGGAVALAAFCRHGVQLALLCAPGPLAFGARRPAVAAAAAHACFDALAARSATPAVSLAWGPAALDEDAATAALQRLLGGPVPPVATWWTRQVRERRPEAPARARGPVAPRNEVEQTIAEIWQSLLGYERIGVHDDFFELGGHSLLALQVLSRVREAFEVELSMRAIFECRTVAELAEVVGKALASELGPDVLATIDQLSPAELEALLQGEGDVTEEKGA